ncbi:ABC transporter substrate-binding protein [Gracilibacillus sp. YIM 98692]|uniref:ABC transporter substrate-binding protein n=1 Tax=Gracilibacillus sp. YIM 98692 TaxID=2663532 RepID=UPI0013D76526|nr:ABC transporter substrate-binding protein [Gracilibacillus sp. YIM 98692]
MKKLKAVYFVVLICLVFSLVACSNESNDETNVDSENGNQENSEGESNNEANNENGGDKTLKLSMPGGNTLLPWVADEFEKANPDVTVDIEEYDTEFYTQNIVRLLNSEDDRPDVAWYWTTGFYPDIVESGALIPLNDLYESEGWNEALHQSSIDGVTSPDGNQYAVPIEAISSPIIYYNKKAFEEAGVEVPTTYEEMLAMGPALRDAGYIPWTSGLAEASQATQLFDINLRRHVSEENYDKYMNHETIDFTQSDTVAMFETIVQMSENLMEPGAAGVGANEARQIFAQGRAAMYSDGSWQAGPNALGGEIPDDFELGVFLYPEYREDVQETAGYYDRTGIMAVEGSGNEELAKEFIAFLLSYDVQSRLGESTSAFPIRSDINVEEMAELYSPAVLEIYELVQEAGTHSLYNATWYGEYRSNATQLIQGLVTGGLTPEEMGEEFTKMLEEVQSFREE